MFYRVLPAAVVDRYDKVVYKKQASDFLRVFLVLTT